MAGQQARSRPRTVSPEIAQIKAALGRRAEKLTAEANAETVGTFKYIISARLAHEFRELMEEL